jgi:hypothetical protein
MGVTSASDVDLKTDVQVIREILFGEQSKLFQQRIETLENEAAGLKEEIRQLRAALADEMKDRQRESESGEERLKQLISDLTVRQANEDQVLRQALDELRQVAEARFKQNEAFQSTELQRARELASGLLAALEAYRQHTPSALPNND